MSIEAGLLFEEGLNPVGAGARHETSGRLFPGHLVPAAFVDEFIPLPRFDFSELFELSLVVRRLHELGDTNCGLARQHRFVAFFLGLNPFCAGFLFHSFLR